MLTLNFKCLTHKALVADISMFNCVVSKHPSSLASEMQSSGILDAFVAEPTKIIYWFKLAAFLVPAVIDKQIHEEALRAILSEVSHCLNRSED